MKHGSLLKSAIKVSVSGVLLLYLLVFRVPWSSTLDSLQGLMWPYFILALVLTAARLPVAALRWHLALQEHKPKTPITRLIKLYLIAGFFNLILPTAIGGDVVRMHELARLNISPSRAVSSVLAERIAGFLSLGALAAIALLFMPRVASFSRLWPPVLVVASIAAFLVAAVCSRGLVPLCTGALDFLRLKKLHLKINTIHEELRGLICRWLFPLLIASSLAYQLVGIAAVYVLGISLGLSIPLSYLLIVMPLVYVVTMVPVSVGGLGIREELFVVFFVPLGISAANALTLSLLLSFQLVLMATAGALLYLWHTTIESKKKASIHEQGARSK